MFNTGVRSGFCLVDLAFRQGDGLDDFLKSIPDCFFHVLLPSCLPCIGRNANLLLPLTGRTDVFQGVLMWYSVSYHTNEKSRARDICNRNNKDPNSCIFAYRCGMVSRNMSFPLLDSKTGILSCE